MGYDIKLFNYYNENEILLEPERKFKVIDALPPVNDIIHVTCSFYKTPLILDNNNNNEIDYNINTDHTDNIIEEENKNDKFLNKYVIKIEMEAKIKKKEQYIHQV